jgi:hypothetical protein
MIESDEVIHVRVRHEHVAEPQDARGRQPVDTTQVEQHGAALMAQSDVQSGIAERRVDQARCECGAHVRQELYAKGVGPESGGSPVCRDIRRPASMAPLDWPRQTE